CCVDEIAAAHASCDAIVHYGDACLSSLTKNIPVKFVFGSLQCNLSGFHSVDKFLVADTSVPILLLTDACYSEKIVELEEIIRQLIPKERCLFVASLADPTQDFDSFDGSNLILCLGRVVPKAFCEAVSVQVCFVGDQKSPLIPLWLMMNTQCSSLVTYDPQSLSITQET
ncbi:unnamed protein product, partial [Nippostrongylus brasiliensis]|uniref:Diphthamide biosynthesis protein 2 (inferred by orthology to a C. elegans protein) n=1 Tax=Nippostrongylus brasiliensis TaxID=27835 RepID=A0A0N4YP31_NIPBR